MVADLTLEQKIDELLELAPIIRALGAVVIRNGTVTDRTDLHKNTLSKRDDWVDAQKRKTYIEVGEIAVIKRRKGKR
jgi:hypothetical protein